MREHEQKLASQCGLTLITEMDPILHTRGAEREKAFAAAGIDPEESFDLLSVPSFKELLADANRIHALVENVKLALSLHRPETVVILHKHEGYSCQKCREAGDLTRILEQRCLPASLVNIFGNFQVREDGSPTRLIITCMDYRLHRGSRLQEMVNRDCGTMQNAWVTYPGAAHVSRNLDTFMRFLNDIQLSRAPEEICIISHTDCAKYKGSVGPKERDNLMKDLMFVKECLERLYTPRARINVQIANLDQGKVKYLSSVFYLEE